MGLRPEDDNVHILNPYDSRSAVWNLGEATQSPVMARALAALMVPEERNTTAPFFSDAGRELVYSVILALNHAVGTKWTFRDLLCALDSSDHITRINKPCPIAKRISSRILEDKQHSSSVLSTLATKLGRFEQVAALWATQRDGSPFSIEEFLSRPGVLVLGNDPVLRESFWPINAMLLKALTNEILRRPNTRRPRHWFIFDEFRAMENVSCIHELLNRGRSKGASVLLGIQSIEGLVEVYGDSGANDILSQCAYKTFLRAGSHSTAGWAERHFGSVRRVETSYSYGSSTSGSSSSRSYSLHDRSMFLASFFLDIPFPGPGAPYTAVCDVPCLRETIIVRRWFDDVIKWCKHPVKEVPGMEARKDERHQVIHPWDSEEEARFCGSPDSDTKKKLPTKNDRHHQH
jgi:type IV secretory pathway TraG/TraD family ATPase VirD4